MKISDFDYQLPEGLIAQYPQKERDQARLMVIDRKSQKITNDIFKNLKNYLPPQSCLVLNNSRVIKCRLFGQTEKGKDVEIFLLKKINNYQFKALIRPLRKIKVGEKIILPEGIFAKLLDVSERIIEFNKPNVIDYLEKIGHVPLPPYIARKDESLDKQYYQTVYAKCDGSVAAPTAGLHFTTDTLNQLKKDGHCLQEVTLHVNYGTFNPVKEENVIDHKMHTEEFFVSYETFKRLKNFRKTKKIVAVGTTSCRVLETISKYGTSKKETDLFIYPGYQFQMVDALLTNFHLPRSTLLLLVSAFAGKELLKKAYQEAIRHKYRFYSYGDAMLIL
jgi:S-adenosylmethionine:tRNA ribosyltransferase-isomerase